MYTPLTAKEKEKGRRIDHIEVKELYNDNLERLDLAVRAGKTGLTRKIEEKELHRPGLALAGFLELFSYHRVQILGNTEIRYLDGLTPGRREESIRRVMEFDIPALIVTNGNEPPEELIQFAEDKNIPLFISPKNTTDLFHLLSDYLDDCFSPAISVHGSLMDVYGTGMLITGRSGIGKSEISLDLVERGHRLVADDVVKMDKKAEGVLVGSAPENIRHIMEVRGVGLIDVARMFGVRGVRMQKRVEVEVHLEEWDDDFEWERIGLDYENTSYLGVEIPLLRLPIFPGKNISMVAEVIALQIHLRVYGVNAAEEFFNKTHMGGKSVNKQRLKNYLMGDYE